MKRLLAIAIVCILAQPALAGEISPSTEIFDRSTGLLKYEHRACKTNDQCTYVANICSGWLAVNTSARSRIRAVLAKISAAARCGAPPPDAARPVSECREKFCTLVPDVRQ